MPSDPKLPEITVGKPSVDEQFSSLGLNPDALKQFDAKMTVSSKEFESIAKERLAGEKPPSRAVFEKAKQRVMGRQQPARYALPFQSQLFSRTPNPHAGHSPPSGGNDEDNAFIINDFEFHFVARAEGSGSGWGNGDEQQGALTVYFSFLFTPTETANYTFTSVMWAGANYLVHANDTFLTSKNAALAVDCGIYVFPVAAGSPFVDPEGILPSETDVSGLVDYSGQPWGQSEFYTLLDLGDDNINAYGTLNDVEIPVYQTMNCDGMIAAGTPTVIACTVDVYLDAKGAGAISEIDFSAPGMGIICPFVRIDQN